MLSIGIFPDRLKYSEVKPIYKKGDKLSTSNYRPISLLPAFSKNIEKIIYKILYQHLATNNILTKEQFALRCNTSTEMAIYALINNVLASLNNKLMAGGIFVIFRKHLIVYIMTYSYRKWNIMV
jgi:hypothetical protein